MSATIKGAAASAAPAVPVLRRARAALAEAIADGAVHLAELHALVEDELIEAINRERREVETWTRCS